MSDLELVRWAAAFTLSVGLVECVGCVANGGLADLEDPPGDEGDTGTISPGGDAARPPRHDSGVGPVQDSAPLPGDTGAPDTTPPPPDDAGPGTDCYSEKYTSTSLADLKSAYSSSKWLSTTMEALKRRYPDGWAILDAEKSDPQLAEFASPGSFGSLMESVDTMCHEETHGWDFDAALSTPGKHVYHLRTDLVLKPPKLSFFARNELLSYITDSATSLYDGTYLKGEQGTYDFIFLADELTAYTNGLACVTALGDYISTYGTSFRDGAAAHILYLQWYLNRARTAHSTVYDKMKADPEWMRFVRFSWARVHFWNKASKVYPTFGIKDAEIWTKIDKPENLAEIEKFTGESPASVACKP